MHSSSIVFPNSNSEEKNIGLEVTSKMQNIRFIQHPAGDRVPVIGF